MYWSITHPLRQLETSTETPAVMQIQSHETTTHLRRYHYRFSQSHTHYLLSEKEKNEFAKYFWLFAPNMSTCNFFRELLEYSYSEKKMSLYIPPSISE